jgi:lipopolysaccharide assembly LptE-like protein
MSRRRKPIAFLLVGSALALVLPSCEWDGQFTVLGYTTRPNYDPNIHTVYVPIFKNKTIWRGLEFELTQAVVREINAKTPFRVVSDRASADTELTGTIISFNKAIINRNQLNEVREAETTLSVEVVWRNLRTGEVLSQPRKPGEPPPIQVPPPLPGAPVPPAAPAPVVQITSVAGFIPELGASITTARQDNVNRLAVQIVSMMEKPW